MAEPAVKMSLEEQRRIAQSLRQEMGIQPDEDDAMKVCLALQTL